MLVLTWYLGNVCQFFAAKLLLHSSGTQNTCKDWLNNGNQAC